MIYWDEDAKDLQNHNMDRTDYELMAHFNRVVYKLYKPKNYELLEYVERDVSPIHTMGTLEPVDFEESFTVYRCMWMPK